jgi:hypothetical protein
MGGKEILSATVSKAWLEGEAAAKSAATCSGCPHLLYSVEYYDWWKGFHATTDRSHNLSYDFKAGQPMTQQQLKTEMDAITPQGKNKHWCEGWDARIGGASRLEYPYDAGTSAADEWIAGWDANRTTEQRNGFGKPSERQEGGTHYRDMKIQPFEYIQANALGYAEGNVIKYVSRYKAKNGIEDLKKARHYIDLLIEHETKGGKT